MGSSSPVWKRLFDAVDGRVSPTIDEMARSDQAATFIALGRRGRSEVDRRVEQMSRRALHLMNLPAGSDVNRLLDHIARLEREVRELRKLLTDRENAEYLASLEAQHAATRQAATQATTKKKKKPAAKKQQTKKGRSGGGAAG